MLEKNHRREIFSINFTDESMTAIFQHSDSLGADIRSIRKSRGLTLIEMAERMDRSVGWMSQVERNISQPNIDELREIARHLDVPLSIFFGQTQAQFDEVGYVVRKETRRKIGGGAIGLTEELLSPDLTDDFEVIHSCFAPGARLEKFVTRSTHELGYVISGKLSIWIDDQFFQINAGDSFRIRKKPFRWENPNDEEAIVIWVISPPVY